MNRNWLLILIGVAVVIGFAAQYGPSIQQVPDILHGHWITDDPRYENCFLQITEDYVDVRASNGKGLFGVVTAIETESLKKHTKYVITYRDSLGLESFLSLRYEPSSNGILRLANQKNISWRRMSTLTP